MTTIAYKNGVISADSRLTDNGEIISETCQKIIRLEDGRYAAFCGDDDERALIRSFTGGRLPSVAELAAMKRSGVALIVDPERRTVHAVTCVFDPEKPEQASGCVSVMDPKRPYAMGSGGQYAMGAMMAGLCPPDAVRIAKKCDVYTGGAVKTAVAWKNDRRKK